MYNCAPNCEMDMGQSADMLLCYIVVSYYIIYYYIYYIIYIITYYYIILYYVLCDKPLGKFCKSNLFLLVYSVLILLIPEHSW